MAECVPTRPLRPPPPRQQRARATPSASAQEPPPENPPSENEPNTLLSQVKDHHDQAYKYIQQALTIDEQGNVEQAKDLYTKGIGWLNKGIDLCQSNDCDSDEIVNLQQKMTKTLIQIQQRLHDMDSTSVNNENVGICRPPSYEEATSPNSEHSQDMWADDIMESDNNQSLNLSSLLANAEEIFGIDEEVQTYFISPEGYVSAPSYPTSLRIYKFLETTNESQPPAFIQVGDWTYPLQPGSSPMLQVNEYGEGAYLFPDINIPGGAVGLILPATTTQEQKATLDVILSTLTVSQTRDIPAEPARSRVQPERPAVPSPRAVPPSRAPMYDTPVEERTSTKIAKGVTTAAEWISWGLSKGAEKSGQLIKYGSGKLREKWNPEKEPVKIDNKYQKGVKVARDATHVAVTVSGFLVTNLCKATVALGKQLAPHVKKQGAKLVPRSIKDKVNNKDGESKVDDVLEVAASGLHGFGVVYNGLENAAKALFKSLANETVNIVHHKYGVEAACLADNAIYAAGNTGMAYHNVSNLGVKAIAKRAAKDTGKAVVNDMVDERQTRKSKT